MPTTDPRDKLRALTGTFTVRETLAPSPSEPGGSTASAKSVTRMDCGGRFAIADYAQLEAGEVVFAGHGVYGYDAKQGCYTMYWFDSATPGGFINPARGSWQGDTLTFVREGEDSWGRYTYEFADDGYTFRLERSTDGQQWSTLMRSVYTRVR